MKPFYYKLTVVTAFAVAMGFLEAVVVVYLREIYYPDGFSFPLAIIEPRIFGIELVRELTTLVMLVTIGLLAGRSRNEKFAMFLFVFGVWDIIYYVGLKLFLGWPASLLTWDILFLIPVTWTGPVLAPVICSITMIVFGVGVSWFEHNGHTVKTGKAAWITIITGAVLIFASFVEDYTMLLYNAGYFTGEMLPTSPGFVDTITTYVPDRFNWLLFGFGEGLIVLGIFIAYRLNKKDG
jgi:hypothetical protein